MTAHFSVIGKNMRELEIMLSLALAHRSPIHLHRYGLEINTPFVIGDRREESIKFHFYTQDSFQTKVMGMVYEGFVFYNCMLWGYDAYHLAQRCRSSKMTGPVDMPQFQYIEYPTLYVYSPEAFGRLLKYFMEIGDISMFIKGDNNEN